MTADFVHNAIRLGRDPDRGTETWQAEIHGIVVTADIEYAEFLEVYRASRGAMPFRDYVIARLIRAAGIPEERAA